MNLRKVKRIISILLIAAFMTVGFGATALATVPATVNTSGARVYQYPSAGAASIPVPNGLSVQIGAIAYGWAWVSYNGYKAFMPLSWLSPSAWVPAYTTKSTNLYAWNLTRMGGASSGMPVYALGTIGNYFLVSNVSKNGLAYVPAGTLTPATSSGGGNSGGGSVPTPPSGLSGLDLALWVATQLVGRPYAANSNPPYTFNCSTLVHYCLSGVGYSVGQTAAEQASDERYAKISPSNIQKGDILCFSNDGKEIDHTALYLGGNKFVEASLGAGVVRIMDLDDNYGYYRNALWFARRPY